MTGYVRATSGHWSANNVHESPSHIAVREGDIFPADHWLVLSSNADNFEPVNPETDICEAVDALYATRTQFAELVQRHGNSASHWTESVRQRASQYQAKERGLDEQIRAADARRDRIRDAYERAGGSFADSNDAGETAPSIEYTPRGTTRGANMSRNKGREASNPWVFDRSMQNESDADLRSRALVAVDRCTGMPDAAREYATQVVQAEPEISPLARWTIATSDPAYLRAFGKWMGDPTTGPFEWTPEERAAYGRVKVVQRALNITTGGSGQFAIVPFSLDPQILVASAGSVNPMREVARVEKTATNEARFVTSLGVTASWDAESAEVSDDTPALLQPTLKNFKGMAFVPVTFEFYEDSNIVQQVGELFADSKNQLEALAFTTGAGSTEPKGVITAIAAVGGSVVISAGAALAVADALANQNALPARWRPNARWMANLSIINQGRTLPLYANGPALVSDATTPPRMLGWEVRENSSMDGTIAAGTTNDYCLLSGDFKQYAIVDRLGTSVEVVPHLLGANRRPSGERGFLMHWRTGGDVLIPDAFRLTNYSA